MIGRLRILINKPITGDEFIDNCMLLASLGLLLMLMKAIAYAVSSGDMTYIAIWSVLVPLGAIPMTLLVKKVRYIQRERIEIKGGGL
ncbi:hypothetical protein LZT27_18700 [Aeromonas veronii]|uniref:hypothetical protein n=1 Tax=Aeromonas veronii TaxID=654 RepID=UPI0023647838|nr:hypothetical protein [Aeromonas veronii]MDD1846606.1 hypothetical protein [Aeromonas veronii]